jgi:hypothetical protein
MTAELITASPVAEPRSCARVTSLTRRRPSRALTTYRLVLVREDVLPAR